MTSSELEMWLWIFCPQMTLHDVPKMFQIGVNSYDMKYQFNSYDMKNDQAGNQKLIEISIESL